MARDKTMVSLSVIGSDDFVDLSHSAQALYMQLNVRADGIGCASGTRGTMRILGVEPEALEELERAGFIIRLVDDGGSPVHLVRHWWVMNKVDTKHLYCGRWGDLVARECGIDWYVVDGYKGRPYELVDEGSTTYSRDVGTNITERIAAQATERSAAQDNAADPNSAHGGPVIACEVCGGRMVTARAGESITAECEECKTIRYINAETGEVVC